MSFALASATLLNKRNMSAPSLFPQNQSMGLSREQLERIGSYSNTGSPIHRMKYVRDDRSLENMDVITINVSGRRYQTYLTTLQRFPNSLLGDPMKRKHFYNKDNNEYFFDRNRKAFGGILHYYQSDGDIACPGGVSEKIFAQELLFFELYGQKTNAPSVASSDEFLIPSNSTLAKIWILFEKPKSSRAAEVLAVFSICVIILSITVFCLETIPQLNPDLPSGAHMKPIWYMMNVFCNVWFTVEFIIRFIAAPAKWKFCKEAVNLIDLLSILPFYISEGLGKSGEYSLAVLRVIRVIRVIRIFKLTRHSRGLHVLANTIKASFQELIMLVLFLAIAVILFASAVYFAETHSSGGSEHFRSIPHSFWWAVITMTTVGYGDLTPKTLIGQMVGALCAISGVLVIALPVPVIVGNFEHYYKLEQSRQAREDEIVRKQREEEAFADMRHSIQMMTHTSIILAGGIRRRNVEEGDQNNNSGASGKDQNSGKQQNSDRPKLKKQRSFRERIHDKLSFTIPRLYSDIEPTTSEQDTQTKTQTNGRSHIMVPDISIDPPRDQTSLDGPLISDTFQGDDSLVSVESSERLWFIGKPEKNKESKI